MIEASVTSDTHHQTERSPRILDVLSQALEMHPQNLCGGPYSAR